MNYKSKQKELQKLRKLEKEHGKVIYIDNRYVRYYNSNYGKYLKKYYNKKIRRYKLSMSKGGYFHNICGNAKWDSR